MTVYELIRELAKYPPDSDVVVKRTGQNKGQRVLNCTRPYVEQLTERGTRRSSQVDYVLILTDWQK